jgi:hypothetical protein
VFDVIFIIGITAFFRSGYRYSARFKDIGRRKAFREKSNITLDFFLLAFGQL